MDWECFINEHGPTLLLYAKQWSNCAAEAEDNVFEAVAKLDRKNRSFATGEVFTAVKHAALDRHRSEKRRRTREQRAFDDLHPEGPSFQPANGHAQLADDASKALDALPGEQREVLVLKIWAELSFKEIADQLGITQNTAASRYRYALEKMRSHMGSPS